MSHTSFRLWLAPSLLLASLTCAAAGPDCQEQKLFGDQRRFECSIDSTAGDPAPRFTALFSGGHDDTMAGLTLKADGADIDCAPGSKPELNGEYGNVSLVCHLPVGRLPAGRHVFAVDLHWSHAQYEGFRLER